MEHVPISIYGYWIPKPSEMIMFTKDFITFYLKRYILVLVKIWLVKIGAPVKEHLKVEMNAWQPIKHVFIISKNLFDWFSDQMKGICGHMAYWIFWNCFDCEMIMILNSNICWCHSWCSDKFGVFSSNSQHSCKYVTDTQARNSVRVVSRYR